MKYILSDNISLRSWRLVPYACYIRGERNARGLKKDEYELLRLCDGRQDIADSALLRGLLSHGFCRPAKEGDALSDWQKEKVCDNRYFPAMNWMITGRCNYNCLHCFNAADNSRLPLVPILLRRLPCRRSGADGGCFRPGSVKMSVF